MISQLDSYTWIDFLEDSEREYSSLDELCKMFISNYPRVIAHITYQNGYFLKKDTQEHLHTRVERLNLTFRCRFDDIVKGKFVSVIKEMKLEELLKQPNVKE